MFKFLNFLVRKPGLTPEQFRDYYDKNHVPLAFKTFPQILEHRRNYPADNGTLFPAGVHQPWDAIVEIYLDSREGFDAMMAFLSDADKSREIVTDGDQFLDGPRCGMMIVDEVVRTR
jgi:hypothetical protein